MFGVFVLFFYGLFFPVAPEWYINSLLPQWYGVILGASCLIQFMVSLWIDRRYDKGRMFRSYFWVIWYPLFFWILTMLTTVVSLPKTIFKTQTRARWISPDRGFRGETEVK